MSFAFVGRFYSSLKGFYNEINSATLTGAIDVVIVKQEDGSYQSSPFHVRFGKLGVLRAREKIVDIEINGQPVDLHMKLGEAGEAFFVQQFHEDQEEAELPAYLATSPIESCEELMTQGLAKLKAHSQHQHLQLQDTEHQDQQCQRESDESMPLSFSTSPHIKDGKSDSSVEEDKKLGKPRRKVLKKKKQKHGVGARSSPRSQSMPEGLGQMDPDCLFQMDVTESTSEEEEKATYSLGTTRSTSLDISKVDAGVIPESMELSLKELRLSSLETFLTPLSEPEMTPPQSPLPTRPPSPKSDTELDRQHVEEKQQQLLQDSSATWDWGEFPKQAQISSPDRQPSKERIDSILERQDSEKVTSGGFLSLWNKQKTTALAASSKKEAVLEEKGIYLDDLASLDDPEIAKLYLGSPSLCQRLQCEVGKRDDVRQLVETDKHRNNTKLRERRFQSIRDREDDSESGQGTSLPQSPHSVDDGIGGTVSFLQSEVRHLGVVSLSLCGGLAEPQGLTLDKFMKKVVTFDDLAEQPGILSNPDLVIKIRDRYFNWATAAPMVLCEMAFNKQLPQAAVSSLVKKNMPKKGMKKKGSWWSWRSSTNQNADGTSEEMTLPPSAIQLSSAIPVVRSTVASDSEAMSSKMSECSLSPVVSPATSPPASVHGTPKKYSMHRGDMEQQGTETDTDNSEKEAIAVKPLLIPSPESSPPQLLPLHIGVTSPSLLPSQSPEGSQFPQVSSSPIDMEFRHSIADHLPATEGKSKEKYMKTLRLTSEQVAKLNLREGQNSVLFSVTTQYQGTSSCMSHIYLWNYDDKIVISDIDGTITKSDVMGQILPLIGRDWSQSGVAQLFTRLSNNGYKLLYLSARAIGQSRLTKDLLKSIKQGDRVLPDGPLLLNPTSLISAFHREVIVRNPEEFKIQCLKDIATLFPSTPFYAGFGNKINDVIAYRALEIPSFRIFTINPQGQLRHDLSYTFVSSYSKMSDIADHFFPPINTVNKSMSSQYSNVNYWRTPPPTIDLLDPALLMTVNETSATSSTLPITVTAAASTATTTATISISTSVKILIPEYPTATKNSVKSFSE